MGKLLVLIILVTGHVKVTTISDDRSILDKHIIPGIGNIRLKRPYRFKTDKIL